MDLIRGVLDIKKELTERLLTIEEIMQKNFFIRL